MEGGYRGWEEMRSREKWGERGFRKECVGTAQSKNDKGSCGGRTREREGRLSSSRIFWEHRLTATGRFI